jgi:hypothetical protein
MIFLRIRISRILSEDTIRKLVSVVNTVTIVVARIYRLISALTMVAFQVKGERIKQQLVDLRAERERAQSRKSGSNERVD